MIKILHKGIQLLKKSLNKLEAIRRRRNQGFSRQSRKETEASLKDVSSHYAAAGSVKCVSDEKKRHYTLCKLLFRLFVSKNGFTCLNLLLSEKERDYRTSLKLFVWCIVY